MSDRYATKQSSFLRFKPISAPNFSLPDPRTSSLRGSTADEKPLVDRAVDLLGREFLIGGQGRQLLRFDAARRVGHGQVGRRDAAGLRLAGDQSFPSLTAFANDI